MNNFLYWNRESESFLSVDCENQFLEKMHKYIAVELSGDIIIIVGLAGYGHKIIWESFYKRNAEADLLGGGFIVVSKRFSKFCIYGKSDTYGGEPDRCGTINKVATALGFECVEENVLTYYGYIGYHYRYNKTDKLISGLSEFEIAKKEKGYYEESLRDFCRAGFERMFADI